MDGERYRRLCIFCRTLARITTRANVTRRDRVLVALLGEPDQGAWGTVVSGGGVTGLGRSTRVGRRRGPTGLFVVALAA